MASEVNAVGGWNRGPPGQGQRQFGLAANGFSWRDGGFGNRQQAPAPTPGQVAANQNAPGTYFPPHKRAEGQQQQPQRSLESIVMQLAETVERMDKRYEKQFALYDKRFETVETHLSQMATSLNELKKVNGILPSQVVVNPRDAVNMVGYVREATPRTEESTSRHGPEPRQAPRRPEEPAFPGLRREIPMKWKDPGQFTITCTIGDMQLGRCLLDLGAGVNIMPYDLYLALHLGPLKPLNRGIILANGSTVAPRGKLENVVVRCERLEIPTDFVVMDIGGKKDEDIILGRAFMLTSRMVINTWKGQIKMECGGRRHKIDISARLRFIGEEVEIDFAREQKRARREPGEGMGETSGATPHPARVAPTPAVPPGFSPLPPGFVPIYAGRPLLTLRRAEQNRTTPRQPEPTLSPSSDSRERNPPEPHTSGGLQAAPPTGAGLGQYQRRTARIRGRPVLRRNGT